MAKVAGGAGGDLANTIARYWDGRAQSYSNGVNGELADGRRAAWEAVVARLAREARVNAEPQGRAPRIADLGCGPGFFEILFAEAGCAVDAIDSSAAMLAVARDNVFRSLPDAPVAFHEGDIAALPFTDGIFDVCIARNVTWLMRDPEAAYAEWLRVLRPHGKLVVFDANWYRYLVDEDLAARRREDQRVNRLESVAEDARATSDEEERCERIAAELPMTSAMRPAWDLDVLARLGAVSVHADEDAWLRLWSESEQAYYRSTPLFMVEAVK